MPEPQHHKFKELTLHQLRSFCETARAGSFTAAAGALDVTHATVLHQVHALERIFGVKLVEPHERGCSLTEAGWLLAELADGLVGSINNLAQVFQAKRAELGWKFSVATTPRILVEDLAPLITEFCKQSPSTRFIFLEMDDIDVAEAVEARRADFGFTPAALTESQTRMLVAESSYQLEIRVVGPRNHPLARQGSILPRDLLKYPIVNAPGPGFTGSNLERTLDQMASGPRIVPQAMAVFAASQRELVRRGFGIALVPIAPSAAPRRGFFERSMSEHFADVPVRFVRRRGAHLPPLAEEFMRLVRERLCAGVRAEPANGTRSRQRKK